MNWTDMTVLGIITVFGVIGLLNGFIYSVFRVASFFISVTLSLKLYPAVSKIMIKTSLYTNLKASILKNLLNQSTTLIPRIDGEVKQAAANQVINKLSLPGFMKGVLVNQMPEPSKLIDVTSIMDSISGELAKLVINVLSLLFLYIAIRLGLRLLRFILQGIAKLPVFKQVDKLGGFALGAVEGLLTIYIICAVLLIFNALPQFRQVYESVDKSIIAKFFYHNNFIVDWMFPGKIIM